MYATTNNNTIASTVSSGAGGVNSGNLGSGTDASSNTNIGSTNSNTAVQRLVPSTGESYSPWDMPPIVQPVGSASGAATDHRLGAGLKGFSNLNSTWPHFRSKPHPTLSVPITPTSLSRSFFDMGAPSTPPRSSTFSGAEDSDNAMCTPTFGSHSNGSRRNSAVSVMALDTPPPLSLMDLESSSSSSHSGSSFGSAGMTGSAGLGSLARHGEHHYGGNNGHGGYPFPLFGMRHDTAHGFSRRSSRTNSFSMESRHVRKASEDTNMSDGGNNSGSEQRGRRHSPAVTPYDRNIGRSTLLVSTNGGHGD
jgi:hypothetical protein